MLDTPMTFVKFISDIFHSSANIIFDRYAGVKLYPQVPNCYHLSNQLQQQRV